MVSQIHCGENNSEFILSKNLPTSLTRPGTLTYDVIFQSYTGNAVFRKPTLPAKKASIPKRHPQDRCGRGSQRQLEGRIRTRESVPFRPQLTGASHPGSAQTGKPNMRCLGISLYLCFSFLAVKNRPEDARLHSSSSK